MAMSQPQDVITQVHQSEPLHDAADAFPEKFTLDLRGRHFDLARDLLFSLPESIVYSLSTGFGYNESNVSPHGEKTDVTSVDFSPDCFDYVLSACDAATANLTPKTLPVTSFAEFGGFLNHSAMGEPGDVGSDGAAGEPTFIMQPNVVPEILVKRPALIVLKEDVEYFCLPKDTSATREELKMIKIDAGNVLVKQKRIFEGPIARQADDPEGAPEYHLMRMLFLSGLSKTDDWHFREREPNKTVVSSLQLTRLKVPTDPHDAEAIQAVQKLLLFWKKPARKCWWDKFELNVPGVVPATVHVRKVWTLELGIIGVD